MIGRTLAAAPILLAAGPAAAHGGLGGAGGFLSGALHPFLAVEHLVLLLAVGLLAGRAPAGRSSVFAAVGLGLAAGLAVRWAAPDTTPATVAVLALAGLAGGLLALAPTRWPVALLPALGGLAGAAVGIDTDGAGAAVAPLAGVAVGVGIIVLDAAALASVALRPPFPVALRVAGSWIAAIALLLLTLALAPGRAA